MSLLFVPSQILSLVLIILVSCLCFLFFEDVALRRKYRFPPIVPGLPFIGNLLQMPTEDHGPYLRKIGDKYGEM
jgi:hypothetical protein